RAVEWTGRAGYRIELVHLVAAVRRLTRCTHREDQLAVRSVFTDGMVAVIGGVDHVVGPDADAVGAQRELALTPGFDEIALAVVDHDRVVATADHKDPIL